MQPGLFEAGDDGEARLVSGRCEACGRHHFPMADVCPWCSTGPVARAHLSRHGSLWAWTAVTAAPPGYVGPVPFGFGVVELPEGLRIVTRLGVADPSLLRFGQDMRLTLEPLQTDVGGQDVVTWSFAPK